MTIDPVVGLSLRFGAALLFGAAAIHKLRWHADFRVTLESYRLLPVVLLRPAALLLPVLELAIALGCLTPVELVWSAACVLGAVLLGIYGLAIAINLARGRRDLDCGCGGLAGSMPIGPSLVGRNVAMIALLGVAALPLSGRTLVWLDYSTVVSFTAFLAFAYAAADLVIARAGSAALEGVL